MISESKQMEIQLLSVFLISVLSQLVQGVTYCAYETCWDDDHYCCNGYCCDGDVEVYQLWWFWFIWVVVFLLIVSCVICIRRRRAARLSYIGIAQVPTTGYNTVTVGNQYTHVQPQQYYQPSPTAPYPPQYQPKQPPPPYQS